LKTKGVLFEIQRMRDVKVKNLLVMVGASGSMLKPFYTCSKEVAGKRCSAEVRTMVILGAARILRKFLMQSFVSFLL
jgi:hypothetical protein